MFKKNRIVLVFIGVICLLSTGVFAQYLEWIKSMGYTEKTTTAVGVTARSDGYAVTIGNFSNAVTFEKGKPAEVTLTSPGNAAYIACYTDFNAFEWAKKIISNDGTVYVYYICNGPGNSVIVCGTFSGTATFAEGESNQISFVSNGNGDVFVARYNTDGTLAWAATAGGIGSDAAYSVGVSISDSRVFLAGYFENDISFSGSLIYYTLHSAGAGDIFLTGFDIDTGYAVWAKKAGGVNNEKATALAVSSDGVYITGTLLGAITFGTGLPTQTTLPGTDASTFLAKYNTSGSFLWAKEIDSSKWIYSYGLSTTSDNSVYITGQYDSEEGGTVTFEGGVPTGSVLGGNGSTEIFLGKFDSAGVYQWALSAGGAGGDFVSSITTGPYDSPVISGTFIGTSTFGNFSGIPIALTSAGGNDCFMAWYTSGGVIASAKAVGDANNEWGNMITCINNSNQYYLTGTCETETIIGKGEANQSGILCQGYQDGFIARFSDNPKPRMWNFSGKIGAFDAPQYSFTSLVMMNANSSTNCFGFLLSPPITVNRYVVYKAEFKLSSVTGDVNNLPQFRLRAVQSSNWSSWMRVVDSTNGAAPGSISKSYYVIIYPEMTEASDTINLAFDLMNFNPADSATEDVIIDSVNIYPVTVTP